MAVAERLGEDRQVRRHAVAQVGAAARQPPAERHLVVHQQGADAPGLRPHVLQEARRRVVHPARLHDHARQPVAVVGDQPVEGLDVAVVERQVGAAQLRRHADRLQTGGQVSVQGVVAAHVGGQVPVVPAVVAAYRQQRPARRGPRDARPDRADLAARPRVADLLRPRMELAQQLCDLHLLARVEHRVAAERHAPHDRARHVRVAVAERRRADAVVSHVPEPPAGLVPDVDSFRFAEVRRPRTRRQVVRVLGLQLRAAGDELLGAGEQPLPQLGIVLLEAEQAHGVVVEDVGEVPLVQVHEIGGGQHGADPLDAELRRRLVREVPLLDPVGDHPGEIGAQADRPAALMGDRVVGAEQQPARTELAQDRHQRLRLADGRGVEPDVLQAGKRSDAGDGVGRVETASRVREDQAGVGIALAVLAHLPLVDRIGQRRIAHQVQGDEPAALVRLLPHPLGQELRRRRLLRFAGAGGVAPVDLEAADRRLRQGVDPVRIALRRGQQRGADAVVAAGGLHDEAVDLRRVRRAVGVRQDQRAVQPVGAADDGAGVRPPLLDAAVGRAGQLQEVRDRVHVRGPIDVRVRVGDALRQPADQLGKQRAVGFGLVPAVRRGCAVHTVSHARNQTGVNGRRSTPDAALT